MNITDYLIIAAKSTTVYIFIIIAIRLFGKKELAQLSVIDLVFILLISNSVQNAMVGTDSSLTGGIAAALGLFICNYIFKLLLRRSEKFSKIVQGEKIVLVVGGKLDEQALKKSMLTKEEIEMAVREHGVDDIEDTDLVILEVDGNITVLSNNYAHKTVRKRKKPQLSHNP
ncbi:MAG: DUF421 domain-containing protein [Bacteroidetes bacterium]|nr:DUF421 domain-containing protein [Bacteroidota bacterium]MBS1642118.1 DUF421 domain-containing protein [Bacteroidota bacterium]MBS1671960.1 DUF421 domain-containing protein [Bacteroidota bacterium]